MLRISIVSLWRPGMEAHLHWGICVDLQGLQDLELTPPKDVLFIIGDWNAKVGSGVWPWSTKWSRAYANRVLPREHTGHGKHPLLTIQELTLHMKITGCSIPKSDWLHSLQLKLEKLYTIRKIRLEADCSSDHKILIVKFRLILKKVGKNTQSFRYDLNQILNDYTVYVTNIQGIRSDRQCLKNCGRRFITLNRR